MKIENITRSYSKDLTSFIKSLFFHKTVAMMPSLESEADSASSLVKNEVLQQYFNKISKTIKF